MTGRFATLFALSAALGCSDAVLPERTSTYQFLIDCSDARANCADDAPPALIFRWPSTDLPVRIWVQPGSDLFPAVRAAALTWMEAGLYGEFRASLVSDSTRADVLFLAGPPTELLRVGDAPTLDCRGRTPISIAGDTTMLLPFRITISPKAGARRDETDRCFQIVAAHELGHALGLFLHSTDPTDLMYEHPTANEPSLRDRATFTTLYHTQPNVRVPRDR